MKLIPYKHSHSKDELKMLQALPLNLKIKKSLLRIREWYNHYGGNVAVSFSGGKDSTVLLHLVRSIYPNVSAVFCNTGLEYPENIDFVKKQDNITIIRPKKNFRQILNEYGVCFPSKDVAQSINSAREGKEWAINKINGLNSSGEKCIYSERVYLKYKYLLSAPFKISDRCCYHIKESPLNRFQSKNKIAIFIGTLAVESKRRENSWLLTGCNSYGGFYPKSKPLSFWTNQDILQYIYENKLEISKVYGEVEFKNNKFILTGEQRTGCMFCLIGSNLENPNKFEKMRVQYPFRYNYCMNELGLSKILDYLNIRR